MNGHIQFTKIKQPKSKRGKGRSTSLKYHLDGTGGKIEVCKKMFLSSLGMKTDGIITEFKKATTSHGGLTFTEDKRGKHDPVNKLNCEHIESFTKGSTAMQYKSRIGDENFLTVEFIKVKKRKESNCRTSGLCAKRTCEA